MNKKRKHLKNLFPVMYFILIWVAAGLLLLILPVHSDVSTPIETFLLCFSFVVIISLVSAYWYQHVPTIVLKKRFHMNRFKKMPRKKMKFIIITSGISTVVGNILVLYDRIFVRGVDYSQGFRSARYQWVNSEVRGSFISKIGNLMIPLSYCCLFFGVFHWESLNKREKIFCILTGFGGQVSLAMINGGRSNILTALVFALCTCLIRKYQGKRFFPPIKGKVLILIPAGILLFNYIESLFYAFADNSVSYLNLLIRNLGAEANEGYSGSPFINTIIETVLYLFHGIYYSGAVVKYNPGLLNITDINHNYSFRAFFSTFGSLFNYEMILAPFDRGSSFIAVPGIFLYDYGYIGFVIMTALLGIFFGETMKHLDNNRRNLSNLEVTVCIVVLMHVFMSPITMALGIGYFLFMILGMVVMELVAGRIFGSSGWTLVENRE